MTYSKLASNHTATSDASLGSGNEVSGFSFSAAANSVYLVEITGWLTGFAAAGYRQDWTGPGSSSGVHSFIITDTSGVVDGDSSADLGTDAAQPGSTASAFLRSYALLTTAGTAGTFQLRVAQETSDVTAINLNAGAVFGYKLVA